MQVRPFHQLVPRPLSWLWPYRLPNGKLVMLDGDPGLGKSLLTLDLCARLSTGRPWPDGTPSPGPANVIVLSGEDSPADTVRPRLEALGADLQRVFVLTSEGGLPEPLLIPSRLALLEQALAQTDARLVVIDPVMAFLDRGVHTASDQGVRQALFPLAQLADKSGCTVQLVRHLNKSSGPCASASLRPPRSTTRSDTPRKRAKAVPPTVESTAGCRLIDPPAGTGPSRSARSSGEDRRGFT